jgi:hypothetical protein
MIIGIKYKISLIFFVYPDPRGSEENQFTPLGAGVNKLIFKRFGICIHHFSIVKKIFVF